MNQQLWQRKSIGGAERFRIKEDPTLSARERVSCLRQLAGEGEVVL